MIKLRSALQHVDGYLVSSAQAENCAVPSNSVVLQTFSEEGFYAWAYDRPASPYLWMFSVLIAVVVVGACLFPLAPFKVKLVVVYLSMGLLMILMGALLLRGAVAGATWMAFGRSFWLLPNVLSEVSQTGTFLACCLLELHLKVPHLLHQATEGKLGHRHH